MEKENKNVHAGHRQRMKDKALKHGFESFENHEILEMLLYPTIPQKDTNPLAHELINNFGSFHAVFEADESELLKVKGMSKSAAFLLKSIPSVLSRYVADKTNIDKPVVSSSDLAYEIVAPKYIGVKNEVSYIILMNNAGKVIACEALSSGTVNASLMPIRKVVELCIKHNATTVILAHNHPSGKTTPSMDDFTATKNIFKALKSIGVELIDHIIVSHNGYDSMRSMHQFERAFMD